MSLFGDKLRRQANDPAFQEMYRQMSEAALAEAQRIEDRRRLVHANHGWDTIKILMLVESVTTLPGIARARAACEKYRALLLAEIYSNDPVPGTLPRAPVEVAPDPFGEGAIAEMDAMMGPSRELNSPPVPPELDLRRMLMEEAAWKQATAEFAGPLDAPAGSTKLAALETERDRQVGARIMQLEPRWDTVEPDVPPPLTDEQAVILARHVAEAADYHGRTWPAYRAFKEITGR